MLSPYDGLSIGILSAAEERGYGTAGQPYPIVTGQDAEVPSVKSIIAGEQFSTIFKDTRDLASTAVAMAGAVLQGETPEVNDTDHLRQRRQGRSDPAARRRSRSTRRTTRRSWSTPGTTPQTS